MDKDNSVILRNKKDSKRIRQCRVVFSYKQDHEDELNLNVGEVIEVLGEEEEGWWRGLLHGKTGVFPSNFVEEINSDKCKDSNIIKDEELALPPKPAKILCEVKYSYKAQNDDELSLKEGDIVTLLSRDGQDPGWWKGDLNGVVGVFPDNFVVILPNNNSVKSSEKSPTVNQDPLPIKPSSIALQRKSLNEPIQNHSEKIDSVNHGDNNKTTPPVPSKKPNIAVKKSPSGSNSTGGLFSGIKKKIVDAVDGATTSKAASPTSKNENTENSNENIFDQVERIGILTDVRATRPKAPGRRPPSMAFKEEEPIIPNGNLEPLNLDIVSEHSGSSDTDGAEVKPKLREWEKHKAPWLAEMKLNQAKRTSPSPGPPETRQKLTPTEKMEIDENKLDLDYMSRTMSVAVGTSTSSMPSRKKPEPERAPMRVKPPPTNIPLPRPAAPPDLIGRNLNQPIASISQESLDYFQSNLSSAAYFVTSALGIALACMVGYWFYLYEKFEKSKNFNLHPLLAVIGYLFFFTQFLLITRVRNFLLEHLHIVLNGKQRFWIGFTLKLITMILVMVSIGKAFSQKYVNKKFPAHLYSMHSWLGLISSVLLAVDLALQLGLFLFLNTPTTFKMLLRTVYWFISAMTFLVSLYACALGFKETAWFHYGNESVGMSRSRLTLNILGLFLILFGGFVLQLVLTKREYFKG